MLLISKVANVRALQIAGQVDGEPEVTSSSNDDNQTGSTRTRPIHSGTKSVMIKPIWLHQILKS